VHLNPHHYTASHTARTKSLWRRMDRDRSLVVSCRASCRVCASMMPS